MVFFDLLYIFSLPLNFLNFAFIKELGYENFNYVDFIHPENAQLKMAKKRNPKLKLDFNRYKNIMIIISNRLLIL